MNLIELVCFFRDGGSFENFCDMKSLNKESEVVEIYMRESYDLGNQLAFIAIEESNGAIEMLLEDVKYLNLFDFYFFIDAIEEVNNDQNKSLSDADIAAYLLSLAINDA